MSALLLVLSAVVASGQAPAEPAPPPVVEASDTSAIRNLIDDQIAAFRRLDALGAWRHVAPGLRRKFGSPDAFLRLVVLGYRPVANPRSYTFGPLVPLDTGEWGQWLEIVGPGGERVEALYLLERQPDGTWRTSGCLLLGPGHERPAT